jgi:hypothetical protein
MVRVPQSQLLRKNQSSLNGLDYGIFEEVIAQHESKKRLKLKYSVLDFDFTKPPLPL